MVKFTSLVLLAFLILTILGSTAINIKAQNLVYSMDHQWAQIFINQDGTIDLTYNITLTVISGSVGGFYVGQPNGDYTPGEAVDQYGNQLHVNPANDGSNYQVDVILNQRLTAGQTISFQVTTNVASMISIDTLNPGNYGMQFTPQWIEDQPINDVRIQIVLPQGVPVEDVLTTEEAYYNGTSIIEGESSGLLGKTKHSCP